MTWFLTLALLVGGRSTVGFVHVAIPDNPRPPLAAGRGNSTTEQLAALIARGQAPEPKNPSHSPGRGELDPRRPARFSGYR
jgi:hypothetical protein